jgi:hypothetical protein
VVYRLLRGWRKTTAVLTVDEKEELDALAADVQEANHAHLIGKKNPNETRSDDQRK